tara:strand:+ start:144 stop:398 length:255 start_codon:yes stop_codon:yes gene_type:complete
MKRSKRIFSKFFIVTFCLLIGIPLGLLLGIFCMLRVFINYPFDIYSIAVRKMQERETMQEILDNHDQDIWDKHIARTQQNQKQN